MTSLAPLPLPETGGSRNVVLEHTNNSSKGRLSRALGGYLDTKRDEAGFIGGRNRFSPGNQMMQHDLNSLQDPANESNDVAAEGVCEIWLTSEDTGAYGRDIGTDLPTLLWRLVEEIPEGAMLRLGMTNPPYILEHLEEMAKILSHPRVYAFLHVPVQSASDSVLMDMKREYCVGDFKRVVDFLKERVPGVTIATDIICGFPGETEEDFQETLDLVKLYQFPSLFINQFYPRPGTPAAKMEQVPAHIKKQRTKELSQLFHSYHPYDHKVGERQQVLVTEESFDGQYYVAHNKFYEQVLVPKRAEFKGKMVEVDIYEAGKHFMKGGPVEDSQPFTPSIAVAKEKQKNKEPEGDYVWRSVIAGSLIDRWSLSFLLSSWMQKSAESEKRTAVDERVIGQAEEPAEVTPTETKTYPQCRSNPDYSHAHGVDRIVKEK
ncbi:hypothetical protein fugu_009830 [Takifugu bimaculatus]|uniref:Threonylcarbamoyladenosine tRNA methylthiotransferase n=1 Tax=Takifugu bimaculatus TaxID=433685 RepID=A0A4Z2CDP5_9TELE|nr:hypothetical protein fugu_009830 [Takifugu bimaculatus]